MSVPQTEPLGERKHIMKPNYVWELDYFPYCYGPVCAYCDETFCVHEDEEEIKNGICPELNRQDTLF
jgi:hypothetical protein